MTKFLKNIDSGVVVCLSAVTLALSSCLAETAYAAPLGLLTILCLCWGVSRTSQPIRWLYFAGVIFHALAFYWLPSTIHLFGGFPLFAAILMFVAYCLLASLQFALSGFLFCFFRKGILGKAFLAFPVAWIICEHLFPRLFPWSLVHPLIDWQIVSTHAQYIGVDLLCFLILWIASVALNWRRSQSYRLTGVAAFVLFLGLIIGLDSVSKSNNRKTSGEFLVAMVQGNLDAQDKRDVRQLSANIGTYQRLSREAIEKGAKLIIWPESVLNFWVPENTKNFAELDESKQPLPQNKIAMLFGGLSYRLPAADLIAQQSFLSSKDREEFFRDNSKYFNSTFLLNDQQDVQGVYHKKILMPFGEYLPFADIFPAIKKLSPQTGNFSRGDIEKPLTVVLDGLIEPVRFGVLICYEDLVSDLARSISVSGANVLVNLTNDAWYGDTSAPYQHHLLARWRAIETGRYLLRATNTGLTAVVDWNGMTVASLPIFTENVLLYSIPLSEKITTYMLWGDLPFKILLMFLLLLDFVPRIRRKLKR